MSPDPAQHPSPIDLWLFLQGLLPRPQARRVVRHLLTGCAQCSAEAGHLLDPALIGSRRPTDTPR